MLIIGLGNPGPRYRETRHNVGFRVVELFAECHAIRLRKLPFRAIRLGAGIVHGTPVACSEPLTYMNASGSVVPSLLRRTGAVIEDIVVIFDSVDISPGSCRLKIRGSDGGHRGLKSVIAVLGTNEFPRLAIGVGRPQTGTEMVDHVLGVPAEEEEALLRAAVERAANALGDMCTHDITKVMNDLNHKEPSA